MEFTMIHLAWDEGVINSAMKEILGVSCSTKTVTTYCKKRVPQNLIDNKNYNCPTCINIKKEESLCLLLF